jgi:hypothetical protein
MRLRKTRFSFCPVVADFEIVRMKKGGLVYKSVGKVKRNAIRL